MVVSKRKPYSFEVPALTVDTWKLEVGENEDINEYYTGKEIMEEKDRLTYLGHVISNIGGNMLNIIHKRNNAIGTEF